MPFNLDYVVTAATLCNIIAQVYEKLPPHLQEEHIWALLTIESFQKIDARLKTKKEEQAEVAKTIPCEKYDSSRTEDGAHFRGKTVK
ncbi:hypothetical protein BGZ65_002976 [Modicella reniformis]|uniref:Uncharacterized protein n=1 Tax=Modicella reniformis TaxID=1440133 RepID=A0A9P6SV94_9FUNG|nr:hypothetical protein BGZ65_002976 [Modicella reniformis]